MSTIITDTHTITITHRPSTVLWKFKYKINKNPDFYIDLIKNDFKKLNSNIESIRFEKDDIYIKYKDKTFMGFTLGTFNMHLKSDIKPNHLTYTGTGFTCEWVIKNNYLIHTAESNKEHFLPCYVPEYLINMFINNLLTNLANTFIKIEKDM